MANLQGSIVLCCSEVDPECMHLWELQASAFKRAQNLEETEGPEHEIFTWEVETTCSACGKLHHVHLQAEYVGEVLVNYDTVSTAEFLNKITVQK